MNVELKSQLEELARRIKHRAILRLLEAITAGVAELNHGDPVDALELIEIRLNQSLKRAQLLESVRLDSFDAEQVQAVIDAQKNRRCEVSFDARDIRTNTNNGE